MRTTRRAVVSAATIAVSFATVTITTSFAARTSLAIAASSRRASQFDAPSNRAPSRTSIELTPYARVRDPSRNTRTSHRTGKVFREARRKTARRHPRHDPRIGRASRQPTWGVALALTSFATIATIAISAREAARAAAHRDGGNGESEQPDLPSHARQHVPQILERIDASEPARTEERGRDRCALGASVGSCEE